MEPNAAERDELARRIRAMRLQEYGTRKAAYVAAEVNANTWKRAEGGEPLAERSLVAIVKLLWPETGGDWQAIRPPLVEGGRFATVLAELERADLSPETRQYIREALERMQDEPPAEDAQMA